MADLRFSEVTRALRALSSTYVQRRDRLAERSAFDSAGKRAAYALFYSPLHFLTLRGVLAQVRLTARGGRPAPIVDVGCGAGAAGAAWAVDAAEPASVLGIDTHPWALAEAAFTYATFRLDGEVRRGHAGRLTLPRQAEALVLGWMLNELDADSRSSLQRKLLAAAEAGCRILIIEPIATRVSPWWSEWVQAFAPHRARADEWRFRVQLPDLLRRLDHAAGMRHDELKARTLIVGV